MHNIQPKSARAKQYHDEVFKKREKEIQEEIEKTQLSILIWGPGANDDKMYGKRVEILNELRGKDLDAFFSEEEIKETPTKNNLSLKNIEMSQAQAVDLIIVIPCSIGSIAELHDFAAFKNIAAKMLIFMDEHTKVSYTGRGAARDLSNIYRKVETFKYPEDTQNGNLLNRVLEIVLSFQWAKYFAIKNAESWGPN